MDKTKAFLARSICTNHDVWNCVSLCVTAGTPHMRKKTIPTMNYNTQRCKTVSLVAVNDKPLVISTHRKLISIHFFLNLSSSCTFPRVRNRFQPQTNLWNYENAMLIKIVAIFRNLIISSFDATIRVKRAFHPALASQGFASDVFLVQYVNKMTCVT